MCLWLVYRHVFIKPIGHILFRVENFRRYSATLAAREHAEKIGFSDSNKQVVVALSGISVELYVYSEKTVDFAALECVAMKQRGV